MKYKLAKFFKDDIGNIVVFDYSSQDDYYSFVKKYRDKGYSQVIITSEIMVDLIKYYFIERKFRLAALELIAMDPELHNELDTIINEMSEDRDYFSILLSRLDFLLEETSIDIKKVELNNKLDTSIYLQVNGIFGISEKKYDVESQYLIEQLSRCFDD